MSGDGSALSHAPSQQTLKSNMAIPPINAPDKESVARDDTTNFIVEFSPNDPENPKNWARWRRWYMTILGGILVLNATFASSSPSGIAEGMIEDLHMSLEVATLTISVFVAGYCVGPLLWGPLSEEYGRRPIFLIGFFVYTMFQVGAALAPNTGALIAFRFIAGTFAASPLTNSGALIADIWEARDRARALALFVIAPFAGPCLGPATAGYMQVSGVSWRWLYWVLSIFAGVCLALIALTLPETYAPIILLRKAKRLRKQTGDDRWRAPIELVEKEAIGRRLNKILARPFRVLFEEPMLLAITVYISFIYGVIYLLFEAYPIVFEEGHGFRAGASGLMFLPLFGGCIFGVILYLVIYDPQYARDVERFAPKPVPPEYRLPMVMVAAPIYALAFFWFGWTSYPWISFWAPMMSGVFVGWAIGWIFLGLISYIIDAYLFMAASALAANTVARSAFGAAFPLFATQMYEVLNPRWASTLLGGIAMLMIPIPFVLYKYGPYLRAKSKNAPSGPATRPTDEEVAEAILEAEI